MIPSLSIKTTNFTSTKKYVCFKRSWNLNSSLRSIIKTYAIASLQIVCDSFWYYVIENSWMETLEKHLKFCSNKDVFIIWNT